MAARIYATAAQVEAWHGDVTLPPATTVQLRQASLVIDNALIGAVYETSPQGLPMDADVAEALQEAVCAQVHYWLESGDTGTGASGEWQSASVLSASYSKGTGGNRRTTNPLADSAYEVLRAAGLLPVGVWRA